VVRRKRESWEQGSDQEIEIALPSRGGGKGRSSIEGVWGERQFLKNVCSALTEKKGGLTEGGIQLSPWEG